MAGRAEANPGREKSALSRAGHDLDAALRALRIPVLFLDPGLAIRRFTPEIRHIAAIRSSDVGRPLGDFRLNINAPDFEQTVAETISRGIPRALRVRDCAGRRWFVRISPGRSGEGDAVIAFFPCNRKRSSGKALSAQDSAQESPAESDLNRIVQEVEAAVRPSVPAGVEVSLRLAPSVEPFRVRRVRFGRALAAFLRDLIAELPGGGRIRIETSTCSPPAGAEFLGRCVELRLQTPASACVPALSSLFRAANESGGFARFEAGRAACVSVFFPSTAAGAGSETVLVVDDDIAVRSLVARVLRQKGYTVLEAASGPEALRVAKTHAGLIDLLVTDVRMPYMSGREVADRLQTLYPELRAIYMTGYAEEEIEPHGVLAPGVVLLHKPFSRDALTSKVREVLGHAGR